MATCHAIVEDASGNRLTVEMVEGGNLEELINQMREWWLEGDPGVEAYVIVENGRVVATMMHGEEWNVCVTTYRDGRVELHRCEYVDGPDGYLETIVTPVESQQSDQDLASNNLETLSLGDSR